MAPQIFSTRGVGRAERIATWEAHHHRSLVGLSCRAPQSGEFDAVVRSARVGAFDLAHVVATPHAVRRTPAHIRASETSGRVVYLTRRGDARLVRDGRSLRHGPGSAVVCAVDEPFDREFQGGVDELVIKIVDADAAGLPDTEAVPLGVVPGTATDGARMLVASLHRLVHAGLDESSRIEDDLSDRLRLLLVPALATASEGRRTIVLDFVEAHLHDVDLTAGSIAARLGLTDRTIRRLFASADRSLAEEIRHRRLSRARRMLPERLPIGDIALRCGFASHQHFSRAFRAEFGFTPQEARSSGSV